MMSDVLLYNDDYSGRLAPSSYKRCDLARRTTQFDAISTCVLGGGKTITWRMIGNVHMEIMATHHQTAVVSLRYLASVDPWMQI